MNQITKSLLLLSLATLVTGCGLFGGDKRPEYQGAEYYKNLEIPPDLTAPDTRDALSVPKPTAEALLRFRDNNKLDTIVTPNFDGVRVVNYAGSSWLEVDASIEKVWPQLTKFWQHEGIAVVEARPLLGFVETEWTQRLSADPDAGFFRSLFQRFEPDQKDKFRLRVERFDNGQKTRIYIAHSGIERVVSDRDESDYIWVSLPSNIERERELVARMALYAGLNDEQREQLADSYRPYASLVKLAPDSDVALTMKGSAEFVRRRALRALDRMRMDDVETDLSDNSIHFSVGRSAKTSLKELFAADDDDLAESSWLMQWLNSDAGRQKYPYRLVFSDQDGVIRIEIQDAGDSAETDEDGHTSSTALAEQLRNLLADRLE